MPEPRQLWSDPEFHRLPLEDRRAIMSGLDPEFARLSATDQDGLFQRATGTPPATPGLGARLVQGVGEAATGMVTPLAQTVAGATGTPPPPTWTEIMETEFGGLPGAVVEPLKDTPLRFLHPVAKAAGEWGVRTVGGLLDFVSSPAGAVLTAAGLNPATRALLHKPAVQAGLGAGFTTSMAPQAGESISQAVAQGSPEKITTAVLDTLLAAAPAGGVALGLPAAGRVRQEPRLGQIQRTQRLRDRISNTAAEEAKLGAGRPTAAEEAGLRRGVTPMPTPEPAPRRITAEEVVAATEGRRALLPAIRATETRERQTAARKAKLLQERAAEEEAGRPILERTLEETEARPAKTLQQALEERKAEAAARKAKLAPPVEAPPEVPAAGPEKAVVKPGEGGAAPSVPPAVKPPAPVAKARRPDAISEVSPPAAKPGPPRTAAPELEAPKPAPLEPAQALSRDARARLETMLGTQAQPGDRTAWFERERNPGYAQDIERELLAQGVLEVQGDQVRVRPDRTQEANALARAKGKPEAAPKAAPKAKATPSVEQPAYLRTLDEAAVAAKARIAERGKPKLGDILREESGTFDPQALADYAIVGAAKIARGAKEFSAWSKEMVEDFGETIRPHLLRIYARAQDHAAQETSFAELPPTRAVMDALKAAKPLRAEQEALYTEERGKRIGRVEQVGTTGEAGYHRRLALLKGELPKVDFQSIRENLSPETIDTMYAMVQETPRLDAWEKISAQGGLAKVFGEHGGAVPTEGELAVLHEVFGPDFVSSLRAVGKPQGFWTKAKEAGMQLANVPRSLMASIDLSAPLRQGLFLIGRPKQFGPAFGRMFGAFATESNFRRLQAEIAASPNYLLMRKAKLALTDMGAAMSKREERFMSSWAEKVPGVRMSARAYTGFLNKLRADVFSDLVDRASQQGLKIEVIAPAIADYVNTATGRGSLGALEPAANALNAFFFSPRLMASRLKLLNPVYYIKKPAFVRREALKDLLRTTGVAMTILTLAKFAGAEVSVDPRSTDFAKIKIGNMRLDIGGGFQQYLRLGGQLLSGQTASTTTGKVTKLGGRYGARTRLDVLQSFIEAKQAPLFSLATDLLRGQTEVGQPLNVPSEIASRFVPMVLADAYQIAREDPKLLPLAVPGVFGVGVQTYKPTTRKARPLLP